MEISLAKFNAKKSDLPTMLKVIGFLLRLVTIDIEKSKKNRIPLISYILVIAGIASYFYVYVFSMVWFIFIRTRETQDYQAAAVVLSLWISSLTSVTKTLFFLFCKKNLRNLVQQYLEYDTKISPETSFHAHLHKRLIKIKERVITVWSTLMFTLVSYVSIPIIKPGRNLSENLYVLYGLEPMFETPNYEIAFATMTSGVFVGVYAMVCFLCLIIIIAGYIEAQMQALSDEILEVWDGAIKNYEEVKDMECNSLLGHNTQEHKHINEYIHNKLRDIIKTHQMSKHLLITLEGLLRVTMALDFIFLMIAIVTELLGGVENTYIELLYSFIQLYITCHMGQKLLDASNLFERSVYDCHWEMFDKSNMRMVFLLLLNAQKPLVLTAGGITVLDYVCLMSIIKSTYTLYTTLQSTLD